MSSVSPSQEDEDGLNDSPAKRRQIHGDGGAKRTQKKAKKTRTLGRGIMKVVDLFKSVQTIVESDLYTLYTQSLDDVATEFVGLTDEDKDAMVRDWARSSQSLKIIESLIPNFTVSIDGYSPAALADFYDTLHLGAQDGQGEDINHLKAEVANWLNSCSQPPCLFLSTKSRSTCGLPHDDIGRFLSVIEHDWDNLEQRAKMRSIERNHIVFGSHYHHALYATEDGDASMPWKGYLMSGLLVRVHCIVSMAADCAETTGKTFKFIFTSPSSADGYIPQESSDLQDMKIIFVRTSSSTTSKRSDVAAEYLPRNLVTGRSVAYAAVMLIFSLNNDDSWTAIKDSSVNYEGLYYFIIDYFEDLLMTLFANTHIYFSNGGTFKYLADENGSAACGQGLASQREKLAALMAAVVPPPENQL
ncbi:hypothetical protein DXG01_010984 [Tephrocybe rancida]|nr:hypothetical protein DXG01_010984 [Tephrocybe rancida]